jgi:zinc transport system permease protein
MIELLTYPFFLRALGAVVFSAVVCGIVGSYVVSRRIVFIGGGITHASFGGIGIGHYFGFNPIGGAVIFALLTAISIEALAERMKMRMDTLIGIMWAFGMATGVIFIYITPGYTPNLMSYLFGNILSVTTEYLITFGIIAAAVAALFIFLYREIVWISFDEEFARVQHLPVTLIKYLVLAVVSVSIVFSIKVVGIILIISLITIPQATASVFIKSFRGMISYSIIFSLISGISGLFISYYLKIPSGPAIIFISVIIFIVVKAYSVIKRRMTLKRSAAKTAG